MGQAGSLEELRAAQAVLLPAVMNTTLDGNRGIDRSGAGDGRPDCRPSFRQSAKRDPPWRLSLGTGVAGAMR